MSHKTWLFQMFLETSALAILLLSQVKFCRFKTRRCTHQLDCAPSKKQPTRLVYWRKNYQAGWHFLWTDCVKFRCV